MKEVIWVSCWLYPKNFTQDKYVKLHIQGEENFMRKTVWSKTYRSKIAKPNSLAFILLEKFQAN